MKVLVACEFPGRVRDAFLKRGHDAWSCDIIPTESPGPHYQCDVRDVLHTYTWDLMIAHPPCTHLAVSGARWWKDKPPEWQRDALAFVKLLLDAPIPKIALENPVGCISTHIRKPDQAVQPYFFGDRAQKTTHLWLKNLPLLKPTNLVDAGEMMTCLGPSGRLKVVPRWINATRGGKQRGHDRSVTFQGLANAMAEQWG